MSTQTTPFNQGPEFRQELMERFIQILQFLAWRAMNTLKMPSTEFVIFCIAYDTRWRYIVDKMVPQIPKEYWQWSRNLGLMPVGAFTGTKPILDHLAIAFPDTSEEMKSVVADGRAKCIVLDEEGYSLYMITPVEYQPPKLH